MKKVPASQPGKTGSGVGGLEEEHLPIEQIKHDDGHEKRKGKQKMSVNVIDVDKDKGIGKGGEETVTTLTHKVSKLSLKGSYRKATQAAPSCVVVWDTEEVVTGGERE
ncbi:hypothetical protein B0T25DRAFT_564460 [Lasiosphaeria hispida]|uniref:Uncharacterized protein n=1 Tax=Lasiosphaeria hispida TaxID=260671 RepID=A0AAJ0HQI9_9PEZI|nr:hypothetical protein B0T25DRAFT_564460 [Lasiosphaeria hispida]